MSTARYVVFYIKTLKVLVTTIDAQWERMGDVGSAKYESALLPPCPTIRVLSYSNYSIFRNSALFGLSSYVDESEEEKNQCTEYCCTWLGDGLMFYECTMEQSPSYAECGDDAI